MESKLAEHIRHIVVKNCKYVSVPTATGDDEFIFRLKLSEYDLLTLMSAIHNDDVRLHMQQWCSEITHGVYHVRLQGVRSTGELRWWFGGWRDRCESMTERYANVSEDAVLALRLAFQDLNEEE